MCLRSTALPTPCTSRVSWRPLPAFVAPPPLPLFLDGSLAPPPGEPPPTLPLPLPLPFFSLSSPDGWEESRAKPGSVAAVDFGPNMVPIRRRHEAVSSSDSSVSSRSITTVSSARSHASSMRSAGLGP